MGIGMSKNENKEAILELSQHYRNITTDDLKTALCNVAPDLSPSTRS